MAGRRNDHVVGHRLQVAELQPVDRGVGDDRGDVLGRPLPAGGRQGVEVHGEVEDHLHLLLGRGAPAGLGVFGAKEFLCERKHSGQIGVRNAENRHDHLQRVVHRDVPSGVAGASEAQHVVDRTGGQIGDAALQTTQAGGLEPLGGDPAIVLVVVAIHMDQCAKRGTLGVTSVDDRLRLQHRVEGVVELVVLALDLGHIGMAGHRVERSVARLLDQVYGIVAAQPGCLIMPTSRVGIGGGIAEDRTHEREGTATDACRRERDSLPAMPSGRTIAATTRSTPLTAN